ncbi:hypothetical protein DFS33DRAFT_1272116 [Desarmillaria ectypa]|nr:hypothetical protein DFS33DRAFT_1272116 [Desarmillaria ectypa]
MNANVVPHFSTSPPSARLSKKRMEWTEPCVPAREICANLFLNPSAGREYGKLPIKLITCLRARLLRWTAIHAMKPTNLSLASLRGSEDYGQLFPEFDYSIHMNAREFQGAQPDAKKAISIMAKEAANVTLSILAATFGPDLAQRKGLCMHVVGAKKQCQCCGSDTDQVWLLMAGYMKLSIIRRCFGVSFDREDLFDISECKSRGI